MTSKKTNPGHGPRESISDVAASLSEPFSLANMLLSLHAHHPTITEKVTVSTLDRKVVAAELLSSNSNELDTYELQKKAIESVNKSMDNKDGAPSNDSASKDSASKDSVSKDDTPMDDTPMDVEDITKGNDKTSKSTSVEIVDGSDGGGKYIVI